MCLVSLKFSEEKSSLMRPEGFFNEHLEMKCPQILSLAVLLTLILQFFV